MNNKVSRRVLARTVAAKLLAEPARAKHWLRVLAAYLMEQRLVDDIDLLVGDLAHELYEQSGHLLVDVTSARKLPDGLQQELEHFLKAATGARRVELVEHLDPALLGGFIARTPDAIADASVRTQLKQLASL